MSRKIAAHIYAVHTEHGKVPVRVAAVYGSYSRDEEIVHVVRQAREIAENHRMGRILEIEDLGLLADFDAARVR